MLAHSIKDEAMHFSVVKARPLAEMLDYELMIFDNLVRVHSFLVVSHVARTIKGLTRRSPHGLGGFNSPCC